MYSGVGFRGQGLGLSWVYGLSEKRSLAEDCRFKNAAMRLPCSFRGG